MSRRGRGSRGDLFGNSEPEDAAPEDEILPELNEFLHTRQPKRRGSSRPAFRAASAYAFSPRFAGSQRAGGRRWVLWLRVGVYSLILLFSLTGLAAGISQTASGYSDAGTMANAPVCAAGVDVTTTTENCVGTLNLLAEYGVLSDGNEEELGLDLPPAGSDDFALATFPGDAQFDAAVGDGPSVVRAEFWEGQIVTLSAGPRGETVTTDENPNNNGGNGLGVTFVSVAFALLSILLFIGIRAFRLRWLRSGVGMRLLVSGLLVWFLGFFVAGVCLANQPAGVAPVLALVPAFTAGVTALAWLLAVKGSGTRVRRRYSYR
jgi:hypothetical protein